MGQCWEEEEGALVHGEMEGAMVGLGEREKSSCMGECSVRHSGWRGSSGVRHGDSDCIGERESGQRHGKQARKGKTTSHVQCVTNFKGATWGGGR